MWLQGVSQERRSECDDELGAENGSSSGGFKLFGVRLPVSSASPYVSMRKSMSMGCLSHLSSSINSSPSPGGDDSPLSPTTRWGSGDVQGRWDGHAARLSLSGGGGLIADGVGGQDIGGDRGDGNNGGYISDGMMPTSSNARERKKGVPWTEEEHRLFLKGLQNLGRGDWRGISRNFVISRTPTQVASHAQKYFLRQSNLPKRKRRSSLFDIPSDIVGCSGGEPPFKVPSRSVGLLNLSRSSSSPALHYLAHNPSTNILPILSLGDAPTPITISIEDDEDNDACNMQHHHGGDFLHLWPTTKPSSPIAATSSHSHKSKDIESISGLSLSIAPPSVDNSNMNDNQSTSSCHSNSSSKNSSLISVM